MLNDHNKFIEEVIGRAAKQDNLKELKVERKETEEATIESLMEVTNLSRAEIADIMEEVRKEQIQEEHATQTKNTSHSNGRKASLLSTISLPSSFAIKLFLLPMLAILPLIAMWVSNLPLFEESQKSQHKKVAEAALKPAFELNAFNITKVVLDRQKTSFVNVDDFNLDGYLDILTLFSGQEQLRVFEMNNKAVMHNRLVAGSWRNVSAVELADFNRDGDIDIITTSHQHDYIIGYENEQYRYISNKLNEVYGAKNIKLLEEDFHGKLQFLTHNDFSLELLHYDHESGKFSKRTIINSNKKHIPFDFADMDGDGDKDIVSITTNSRRQSVVTISENLSNGTTSTHRIPLSLSDRANIGLKLADKNNDGYLDITLFDKSSGGIITLFCAKFACEKRLAFSSNLKGINDIVVEDLDNDGDSDLLASGADGNLAVFINQGSGKQDRLIIDKKARGVNKLVVADIHNNGYKDIVAATDKGLILYKIFAN